MKLQQLFSLSIACAIGMILATNVNAWQQQDEMEIVDRDGQRVDAKKIQFKPGQQTKSDIEVADGKIVIVDENGERREIDVTGAQSIIVNKSISSIMRDGEEEKQVNGKAIIIGPDGQRQEILLGQDLGNGDIAQFRFEPFDQNRAGMLLGLPGNLQIHQFAVGSKFAIGVHCQPVSDALRAHIEIDDGIGLVVTNEPVEGSPAAGAGIQKHDILIYADQTQLAQTSDLVSAVQAAGNDKNELSLTLLRKGKEIGVALTPVERKSLAPQATGGIFQPGFKMELQEFGPGFIIGDQDRNALIDGMQKRMDQIDEQFKLRFDELQSLREELNDAIQKQHDK